MSYRKRIDDILNDATWSLYDLIGDLASELNDAVIESKNWEDKCDELEGDLYDSEVEINDLRKQLKEKEDIITKLENKQGEF